MRSEADDLDHHVEEQPVVGGAEPSNSSIISSWSGLDFPTDCRVLNVEQLNRRACSSIPAPEPSLIEPPFDGVSWPVVDSLSV